MLGKLYKVLAKYYFEFGMICGKLYEVIAILL